VDIVFLLIVLPFLQPVKNQIQKHWGTLKSATCS
jgi:hypothetical protein